MITKIGGVTITLPSLETLAHQPAWLILTLAMVAVVTMLCIVAMQTGLAETALLLHRGASAEWLAELKHGNRDVHGELPKRADGDA